MLNLANVLQEVRIVGFEMSKSPKDLWACAKVSIEKSTGGKSRHCKEKQNFQFC